jgi:hypothetical protein
MAERAAGEFHFGTVFTTWQTTPFPSPRSIGIIELATKSEKILGLQQLRGKILNPKELGVIRMPKSKGLWTRSIWNWKGSQEARKEKAEDGSVLGKT